MHSRSIHPAFLTAALAFAGCTDVDENPNDGSSSSGSTAAASESASSGLPADGTSTTAPADGLSDATTAADDESSGTEGVPDVDRGPTELAIDGDANGLWWDADDAVLYIADDNGNRILQWTDADGFGLVTELPVAPDDGAGLGQLVRLADGTFVVTRFGFGTAGDVIVVPPGDDAYAVPGLDPERRRLGLTVTSDGTLYDSWFVRVGDDRVGAIGLLDLAGSEEVVVDALVKPIAVVADGTDLIIADQDLGQILRAPLADPMGYEVLVADIESPDLLCVGPDGSYFTGSLDGSVRQVFADGSYEVFAGGFDQVRGVAFDAENTRLFAADHDGDESDGLDHAVQLLPVDPT